MRTEKLTICLTLIAMCTLHTLPAFARVDVVNLRCEYRSNPVGIDVTQPRLSWQLHSDQRGVRQSAYQILVAGSPQLLKEDQGELWDTGRVESGDSTQIAYAGAPLQSRMRCYWKVRVYDQEGKPSAWSAVSSWSMGLLSTRDWQAQWIGLDAVVKEFFLEGCSWIGYPEGLRGTDAPPGMRYYRRVFDLPPDDKIIRAELSLAADNGFSCSLNGAHVLRGHSFSTAKTRDVASMLHAGSNVIAVQVNNLGEKANPAGLTGKLVITFDKAAPLTIATDAEWRAHNALIPDWHLTGFSDSKWTAAKVLGAVGMPPWGKIYGKEDRRLPARMLRREFELKAPVARATAYFSGLGLSELYVNGKKSSDVVLSPGLTHYTERVFYVTRDLTALLKPGRNALGVWLGNGRYFAPRVTSPMKTLTYGSPKLLMQLEVEYTDGESETIISDENWRLTCDGPIRANNEYDGEEYDARLEMPGWNRPGFDDSEWRSVEKVEQPGGTLTAEPTEPIRVTETLKPRSISEPQPGLYIFDMGQNMVGWCRLKINAPAGTTIKLRHAETLKEDGTLYLDNIRGALVTDTYTTRGDGLEIYEPRFTYHGFRYVEATGFTNPPDISAIEGCVVHDDLPVAGSFSCSKEIVNRIYENIRWGVRGNYRNIPTDCPQRDERQGWLGDRSSESKGESYLYDVSLFYAKWLQDMRDAQKESGSIPDVAPPYWPLYGDSVTWPGSVVIIPDALYEQYSDIRLLEQHYPAMKRWMNYMDGFVKNGIIEKDSYGDWCVPPEDPHLIHSKDPARKTSAAILATTYFCYCHKLMAKYGTIIGRENDARHHHSRARELTDGLNREYYNSAAGYYDNGTQTSCVLPLAFDMVPQTERKRVFNHLISKIINETNGHVGTGLVGGQWLNRVLTRGGRPDISYRFAINTTYPSWGYMVDKGATTIWELWNGDTADPAMNSGNHVMLVGDLLIWLFESLAGIAPDPNEPGFRHIIMRPLPLGDLTFVKADHNSPYGRIRSEWQRSDDTFEWNLTIPPNTRATLNLPASRNALISESGNPLKKASGVELLSRETQHAVLKVGSGSYHFKVLADQ